MAAKRRLALAAAVLAAIAAGVSAGLPQATAQTSVDPATVGQWSAPFEIGVKGIHSQVLRNGRVLFFSYPVRAVGSDARVWDPASGATTDVSLTWNRDIFCAGHSLLPDGRVFVTGGHVHAGRYGLGVKNNDIYDPASGTFSPAPMLSEERWYPTNVTLPDGRVVVFGGNKDAQAGIKALTQELYDPASNTLATLPSTANKGLGNYPRLHLLRNGRIAWTNLARTQVFNPATNAWTASALTTGGGRGESFASVLLPGSQKILRFGGPDGSGGATASAEIGDFSTDSPTWTPTGSMNQGRVWVNPVLLPDGKVLAVGGGRGGTYANPVLQSELFDPATGTWSAMASQQAPRVYHSTAVLLPDGRVLSAGHDNGSLQTTAEIFSPPYLFKGPRPRIAGAPSSVGFGDRFTVSTPDARSIARVALLRPDSVTHSLNQDQRYEDLAFSVADDNTLSVTAPAGGNEAPPGPYMLFLLSGAGVPSVASFVDVAVSAPPRPPAPTIAGFTPTGGAAGTVVTISGTNFTGATAVAFGGVPAGQFAVVSDTSISATVPTAAATGRIRVTTAGGTATSDTDFTVGGAPTGGRYREAVLSDGPVGYWRLGETSGYALDETGITGRGRYVNGVTLGVPGALAGDTNPAARFDGVDDYVSISHAPALDVGDTFTYELWVKRGAAQGTTQRLLHKGAGPAALGFGTNNRLVLLPGGTGATNTATSASPITDQAWHHVVATKSGASARIYVDGVDVTAPGTNTTMTANTTSLNVARASSGSAYVNADLDEVAVYPVALSAERVRAHFEAGRG
jgi:hypothetical protein